MLAIIYPYVGSVGSALTGTTVIQKSGQVLTETGKKLYSIWPIWLFLVFPIFFFTSEGDFRKRLKTAILRLIIAIVFSMIIEVLAARH